MITIIVGTNRDQSKSRKIAEYYLTKLENLGEKAQILDLKDLPKDFVFSALYANTGKHPEFNQFIKIINESEKYIFVVPEYNNSFPGVLKAFIDGLEFPGSFANKKAALVGLSSGVIGAALALSHLTDILNYLSMHVYAVKPRIPRISANFVDGVITDKFIADLIDSQIKGFIKF
ncbi:MAG: NADPH-dependent oxidoreductase [Cytophagales bacterium]|nr:MAG: NADPH-dependent oxidoreductase [Cytophagales bacterium]